jgi:hypothetical protein
MLAAMLLSAKTGTSPSILASHLYNFEYLSLNFSISLTISYIESSCDSSAAQARSAMVILSPVRYALPSPSQ